MDILTIESDLLEYADFEEVASVARAKLFVASAKRWLILRAESASSQSQSHSISKQFVETMINRANAFIVRNTQGQRTRFLHVGEFYR